MIGWRHKHQDDPARLARRAAARLGAERGGLEAARHRRRAGRNPGRRQPMDQAGARRLMSEQVAQLPSLLASGAEVYGLRGQG